MQSHTQAREAMAVPMLEADQKATAQAQSLLNPLAKLMFPQGPPEVKTLLPEQQAELDIRRARAYL